MFHIAMKLSWIVLAVGICEARRRRGRGGGNAPQQQQQLQQQQQEQESSSPGWFSTMATVTGGSIVGNTVGNGISSALFGGGESGGSSGQPAEKEQQKQPQTIVVAPPQNQASTSCNVDRQALGACLQASQQDCTMYQQNLSFCESRQ